MVWAFAAGADMDLAASPLLTDLYQLNMIQAYLDHGETKTAVFEFFVRKLPATGAGFSLRPGSSKRSIFSKTCASRRRNSIGSRGAGGSGKGFSDHLADLRFTGDVHAMPEGTVFFANEPILRVTAPLPEAQLVETRLINILHFQSLIAAKAARMVLCAPGKLLVDFGLRRAHGAEAGLFAARASYIAGFAGTATMLASKLYGIPIYGTMAHSFVQAYDDESAAFESVRPLPARKPDPADRHLRHGERGSQSGVARSSPEGGRHHGSRRAARQRRPCCSLQERAAHPGRRRT